MNKRKRYVLREEIQLGLLLGGLAVLAFDFLRGGNSFHAMKSLLEATGLPMARPY